MIELVTRIPVLVSVLQSVTTNAYQIILTILLGFLITYFYAILGFVYFSQQVGGEMWLFPTRGVPRFMVLLLMCVGST